MRYSVSRVNFRRIILEKVALVTGASRGIGKACALRLAECGYDIVVNYNSNEAKAQEVVSAIEALGQKAVAIKANTADLKEVQNMFREAHKAFGRLDVLVNNAGVVDDAYLLMINEDSLARSLDINIKGYFHCAQQAALKMMSKKQGVIINVSSVSSVLAVEGQGVYSATKGAVNSMTATLAKELAPRGIRVNAVAPGFIETEMLDAIPEDKKEEYLKAIPMHRLGKASEVSEAILKGIADAKKNMVKITLEGTTIPHDIIGEFGAGRVMLKPAPEGTGIIAGGAVRAVMEAVGISNIRAKCLRSNNPQNVVKATMQGLISLRDAAEVARIRGKNVEDIVG